MQNFLKFISKYLLMFIAVLVLVVILDAGIFIVSFKGVVNNTYRHNSPVQTLQRVSDNLKSENGSYHLSKIYEKELIDNNIWGLVISNDGKVIWNVNAPQEIPQDYTIQDTALFSKGYICDYPVFVWNKDDNLLVLGYPKDSYIKITSNYFPKSVIVRTPLVLGLIIMIDVGILFIAYYMSKRNISNKVSPIIDGLDTLSSGKDVSLNIKGELSEIGQRINLTSSLLKKQDQARANWISGVSHDIRTPLSMIMGYADKISHYPNVETTIKEQADIIQKQSIKIKDLVQDLNLVSQLEYNMQLLKEDRIYLCKLLREIVTEYLNNGLNEKYRFELELSPDTEKSAINGDTRLVYRAIQNLISNSINHNSKGCKILIQLSKQDENLILIISDNGKGISKKEVDKLNTIPHYLQSTDDRLDLRHGLGLLLVKEIVAIHNAEFFIYSEENKGFTSKIIFKIDQSNRRK